MKCLKTTLLFFLLSIVSLSQTNKINIKGQVIDFTTNEPLPFANVQVLNRAQGTTTGLKGIFELEDVFIDDTLIVSFVGYKSLDITVKQLKNDQLNIFKLQSTDINLQEITVYSVQNSGSESSIDNEISVQSDRIREIAVGMPDILRSMQSLPGIVTNNEFKADFNVRGGNQDENLVLVNGTRVYEPFHIKEAANASIGIFNVDLMRKVDIITGGFSAKYGDKMSSVLNIDYREGDNEKYSGAVSVSLAYVDGFAEGPLGNLGSFIIGARKSYMEYVLNMIDYEDISSAEPSFYDVQGVVSFNLSQRNRLLFEFIYAGDDFSYKPRRDYAHKTENENNLASYTSAVFGIKSKNILSSKALLNAEINYYDQGDNEYRQFFRDYKNSDLIVERFTFDTLKIKTLEYNSSLQYQLDPTYEINLGLSYHNILYERNSDDIWTLNRDESYPGDYGKDAVNAKSFKYAAYIENIFAITESLKI